MKPLSYACGPRKHRWFDFWQCVGFVIVDVQSLTPDVKGAIRRAHLCKQVLISCFHRGNPPFTIVTETLFNGTHVPETTSYGGGPRNVFILSTIHCGPPSYKMTPEIGKFVAFSL